MSIINDFIMCGCGQPRGRRPVHCGVRHPPLRGPRHSTPNLAHRMFLCLPVSSMTHVALSTPWLRSSGARADGVGAGCSDGVRSRAAGGRRARPTSECGSGHATDVHHSSRRGLLSVARALRGVRDAARRVLDARGARCVRRGACGDVSWRARRDDVSGRTVGSV
jgi:hypothetical protein